MSATVECPRCKGLISLTLRGVLSPNPAESWVEAAPDALSVRRHAGCFGGPDGGEPLPIGVAA